MSMSKSSRLILDLMPGDLVKCSKVWPYQGLIFDDLTCSTGPFDVCIVVTTSSYEVDGPYLAYEALLVCNDGSCGWASFNAIEPYVAKPLIFRRSTRT